MVDADATLVAQPGGRLRKRAGIVRADLAAEVGDGTEVVVVGAPGERIGLVFKAPSGAAKGAAKVGKVTGSSVAYADVYGPGTSLEFEASEAGVKESIVLAAGPAAGVKPEYRFGLNLDGLTARVNASGSVSLLDPDGSEKWVVPVGIAYERPRPGEKPSVLGRVGFALEKAADGTTEFVVRPDEAWLRDPARRFPVVIDPTITPGKDSTSNGFATVDSAYPTWHFNLCRTANSTCFGQVSPTQQSYAYLRYDVSAATGKIINSASLKVNGLDCFSAPAWPATLKVRPLLSPVDLATVTWDTRPAARTIEAQAVASAPGSYSVDVGTFVAKWASGEWPAYGFQIDSTKDCELKVNGVGTASYLEITYTDPTPGTNRPPSIPVSQAPVDGSTVSSPVTMSVTSIDPDGDPLQYYFDSCLQPCSGAFVSSGWLNTPNWVHTPGTNGQYWGWWAYATDGITPWVYNGAKFFTVGTPTGASSGESSEWGTSAAYSATSDDNQPNAGVNTGTKRLVFQATDAQVAAAGPALSIVRTYNSGDTSTGVFGTGWSSILDARVDADGSGNLTFRLPDGRREYHPLVGGEYRTAPGYWTTAGVDPNGGWTLLEKDGSLWRFRTDGKFSQIADRNGRALTAVFDAGGKQTELRVRGYGVTRSLTLGWTGSLITSVTDALSQTWNYGYTGNLLTRVCDPRNNNLTTGLCMVYAYDAGSRINAVTKPKGNKDFEVFYYADGTVNWRKDGMGYQTTYAYNPTTKTSTTTDPAGRVTTEVYNGYRQLVSRTVPGDANIAAHTTTYLYDSNGFLAKSTSPITGSWEYVNDYRGNPVQVKDPTGAISYFDYDTRDLVLTYRDPRSSARTDNTYRWTYGYDANGNRVRETNPYSWSRTWAYNTSLGVPAELLTAETDWNGNTTSYTYNGFGDVITINYPGIGGDNVTYGYDVLGRKTSEIGRVPSPGIVYTYDSLNAPLTITEPPVTNTISGLVRQKRVTIAYDNNHLKASEAVSDIGGSVSPDLTQTTTFGYDNNDRETTRTDPLAGVTTRRFTNVGTVDRVTDARGNWTETVFNARDLPQEIKVRNADPVQGTDTVLTVETRTYDAAGRMTGNVTTDGGTRTYTYDNRDRMLTRTLIGFVDRTAAARNIVEQVYRYDQLGNVLDDLRGAATYVGWNYASWNLWDYAGRRVLHVNESASWWEDYTLDRNANVTGTVRTSNSGTVYQDTSVFDARNRETSKTVLMAGDGANRTSTVVFNKWGTPDTTTDARGNTQVFTYDNLGRLIKSAAPSAPHEPTGGTVVAGAMEIKYGYDTFGNRTHVTDGRGFTTVSKYDNLNRAERTDHPTCTTGCQSSTAYEQWGFDAVGNTTSYRDRRGQSTNFDFDSRNRVVRKTLPALGAAPRATETVKYNAQSQTIEATNAVGAKTTSTYNQMGLPKTVSVVERIPSAVTATSTMDYNDLGQLTWVRDPFNNVTTHAYRATGEKTQTVDPTSATWNWTYDAFGRQITATDPAGKSVATTYNRASEVRTVQRRASGPTVVTTASATYDNNGNEATVVDNRGNTTTMTYDTMNRLVSVAVPGTGTTTYGYDRASNLTRSTNGRGFATTYTYNEWNLSTSTIEPSTTAHPAVADRTFTTTYDAAGLAIGAAEPGATVTRTFNELGALTSETGSGAGLTTASRTFTRDAAGRVLTASHPNGSINFAYNDKDQVTAATGAAGVSGFTYDVKGRMTGRTDAGTALTAQAYSFSYTARDELQTAQDHLVANRTYAWRNDGLLNTITQGATRRDFGYDSIGRLASDTLKVNASNVTLNGVTYGYDNDDNVTSKVVTATGNPAAGSNSYTYDTAGRLATWTNPGSVVTTYGYDNAGNRTAAGAQTFVYDERNRLTSGTSLTNVWSARGSLTSSTVSGVATTYAADGLNRVTGVTRGASTLGFSYDSLDRPWRRTSNSVVSNEFSYAGGEMDAVMTATAGGAQKSVYGRSPTGMLLSGGIIGGAKASVGTDRHGDTTHYFDPTAATVTGTGLFDPYGKPAGSSGTNFPELGVGYQSDWTDPLTGDVNMGARWYDPNTAIFRTRDTVFGMLATPVTLNRYTYGNANPMKYWDPTGREGEIFFGDFFSYADMIALMPQYAPPAPQEPITETFASGTGAYTTIHTNQWGESTFVVTAATGVTVSAPSTTERSGNLSYTPTEAAHLAVLVLDGAGVSATAIAASINDAVEAVAAHPMIEANVSSGPSTADILQSAISIASDRTGTIGAALDALDAIDAAAASSDGADSTVAAAVYGAVGSAARLVDGIFAHLIIQFDWEYVRHKDVEVRYSPTTTGKAYGAVDLVDSSTSVYDFYEIKPRTDGGRTDGLAQRKARQADFLNPIAVANLSANAQGPAPTAVRAGTTFGTCVTCIAAGLRVTQVDIQNTFQDGLVFYEWSSANPVTVGVTAGAAARIARNVRPGAGVIIDINKPRPLPLPIPVPV